MRMVLGLVVAATVAVMLLGAGQARAAGIDCGKAAAGVERMICEDPDLKSLDSQLAAAFAGAMDRSARPAEVRQGQRAWLKVRDACASDLACARGAYRKRIKALSALSDPPAECAGSSTPERDLCAAAYAQRADRELDRYVAAARMRLLDEAKATPGSTASAEALSQFDKSQAAWVAYRKAECDAVYSWWSEGTIRGALYLDCWQGATKSRTGAILSTWLGFMDSTEPLMPPPAAK